jgi:exopolyphosphatase / guanosine-5'-triphosphate,3'-diphosphate pyrophosphatase
MSRTVGIIDLGTNTFHLLIAEIQGTTYRIVHREKVAVKLGLGGINQNVIKEQAIERAVAALMNFKVTLLNFQEIKIHAFGTSALRNAVNAVEVIEAIKKATDIDVAVISGDDEAFYIYKGVQSSMDMGNDISLIMDIGGGSVEFILANRANISWKKSFEIGGQRLLERFQKHDPILPSEILALDEFFNLSLADLLKAINKFNPTTLIGSSGTFDTLSEIYCIRNSMKFSEENSETPFNIESFYTIYREFILKNRAERMRIPGMIEMRVDMIVVACCLIRYILETHSFKAIRVSTYALKEGVLSSMML